MDPSTLNDAIEAAESELRNVTKDKPEAELGVTHGGEHNASILQLTNILAQHLGDRYQLTGNIEDLESAIERLNATLIAVVDRIQRPRSSEDLENLSGQPYNTLAYLLQYRFEENGDEADLTSAIHYQNLAISMASDPGTRASRLGNLSLMYLENFRNTGEVTQLQLAVDTARQSISTAPEDDSEEFLHRLCLSQALAVLYEQSGDEGYLDEAIEMTRHAVEKIPPERKDSLPGALNDLCAMFDQKAERSGSIEEVDEAIHWGREALELTPKDHVDEDKFWTTLAGALSTKYELSTTAAADLGNLLDEAILLHRKALEKRGEGCPDRPQCLLNLGGCLLNRYDSASCAPSDLEEAYNLGKEALELLGDSHIDRAWASNFLCFIISERFERMVYDTAEQGLTELAWAAELGREALMMTDDDQLQEIKRAFYEYGLSCVLSQLYETGCFVDTEKEGLDEAISLATAAINRLRKGRGPKALLPIVISHLATLLDIRGEDTANLADVKATIENTRESLRLTHPNHPNRAIYLNNLATMLCVRFERTGELDDLQEGIDVARAAVRLTSRSHFRYITRVHTLCSLLHTLYQRVGAIEVLTESIQKLEAALSGKVDTQQEGALLGTLSHCLQSLYWRTGSIELLDRCIECGERAVQVIITINRSYPIYMSTLADAYFIRYRLFVTALKEAIQNSEMASQQTQEQGARSPSFAIEPSILPCLQSFLSIYSVKQLKDQVIIALDKAIRCSEMALKLTPEQGARWPAFASKLSSLLRYKFKELRDVSDIDKSIEYGELAVKRSDRGDPSGAAFANVLGENLEERGKANGEIFENTDIMSAAKVYSKALTLTDSCPSARIIGGMAAGRIYGSLGLWDKASEVHSKAVDLLTLLCPRFLAQEDLQAVIEVISGLSSQATAAALMAGKPADEAFRLLEGGRGMISRLALDSKDEVYRLKREYPEMYAVYENMREEVDSAHQSLLQPLHRNFKWMTSGPVFLTPSVHDVNPAMAEIAEVRRNALQKLSQLEQDIRKLEGFEWFQLAPGIEDCKILAKEGPIVGFNVTATRSDAFLITTAGIKAVALPELRQEVVEKYVKFFIGKKEERITTGPLTTKSERNKKLREMLTSLWNSAIEPVLSELGLLNRPNLKQGTAQPTQASLRRIFWLTGGLMGLLPLHATGDYSQSQRGSKPRLTCDHVVSTYVSTLKSLKYVRQSQEAWSAKPCSSGLEGELDRKKGEVMLIVSMPETPDCQDLNTDEEINTLLDAAAAAEIPTKSLTSPKTKHPVLELLEECTIAHFACHGITNPNDPSRSGLLIGTGKVQPTVKPALVQGHRQETQVNEISTPIPEAASLPAEPTDTNSTADDHESIAQGNPDDLLLTPLDISGLSFPHLRLAYCSACSTASVGTGISARLLGDETIHICSALQLIGFTNVIGTLWETEDTVAVAVSKGVYTRLLNLPAGPAKQGKWEQEERKPVAGAAGEVREPEYKRRKLDIDDENNDSLQRLTGARTALALHAAMRDVRAGKTAVGPRKKVKPWEDVLAWAPYVHVGP